MHHKASLRRALSLVLLALLLPALAPGLRAATTEELYERARVQYRFLIKEPEKHPERDAWEKCLTDLQQAMAQDRSGPFTPKCLYLIAQIHHYLYQFHKTDGDAQAATGHYRLLIQEYPHSNLADDAQFMLGIFYLEELHQPAQAYSEFLKVGIHFPTGDMAPRAHEKLAQLESRYSCGIAKSEEKGDTTKLAKKPPLPGGNNAAPGAALAEIQNLRYRSATDHTQVLVQVSGPVKVDHHRETAGLENKMPDRIVLTFRNCSLKASTETLSPVADRLLRAIRINPSAPAEVRLVLDVDTAASYKVSTLTDPSRVVIDLYPKHPPRMQAKRPAPKSKETAVPTLAQQLGLGIKRIVLDPGHGGKDTGAISPSGAYEKDIVLALAQEIKKVLEQQTGCQVILTRTSDRFLSLEERTAMANKLKADMFISIHANAHENRTTTGIETYYLNLASDRNAAQLAAVENASSRKKMSDLESILHELILKSKTKESARLANEVQHKMVASLQGKYAAIRDLGVKQAPFIVLLGAEMPGILIEAAFLSNPQEEGRLQDKNFQKTLGQGIAAGVSSYIQEMRKFVRTEEKS